MNERRIKRLEAQILARAAEVVGQELADPRKGLITITRVQVDRELTLCKIYWSVLGDQREQARNEALLRRATGYVQQRVAEVLHTRTAPRVSFVFDESIAGAVRVQGIIDRLRQEREAREARERLAQGGSRDAAAESGSGSDSDSDSGSDSDSDSGSGSGSDSD